MSDVAICIKDLVKEYEVYRRPLDLAVEVLTRRPRHTKFRALDNVTLEVRRGEVLGIIGPNGAGKSTLLKIITGVLDATSGTVDITGRVTAILELGLGFNPEYSGRENIFLSGMLYGMDEAEITRKLNEIINFSGLDAFIERPVKTYSSGMHARLAFSIATAVDPDILIIDEALAAGDAAFVQKCLRRIRELCSGGRTVLLVSHGTGLLAQLCHRVAWLDGGRVHQVGPAIRVVQAYDLAAHQAADAASWIETVHDDLDGQPGVAAVGNAGENASRTTVEPSSGNGSCMDGNAAVTKAVLTAEAPAAALRAMFDGTAETGRQVFRRGPVFIENVEMLDATGNPTTRLTLLDRFALKVNYRVEGDLPKATLGVALSVNNKHDLAPVAQFMTQHLRPTESRETYDQARDRPKAASTGTLRLDFEYVPFRRGEYLLSIGLLPNEPGSWEFYEYRHLYYLFSVDDGGMDLGAPVALNPRLAHISKAGPAAASVPSAPARIAGPGRDASTSLRAEIEKICFDEGGHPDRWARHQRCPACGGGPLAPAFAKFGFSHARCGACTFVCVDPFPPDDVLQRLYAGNYYSAVREYFELPLLEGGGLSTPFSAPREMLEAIIDRVSSEVVEGRWLDVGGGIGAFAHLVASRKPRWQVALNEFNPQSVEIARNVLGIEAVTADPFELARAGQLFDVVSSVAVLEHIPAPLAFLEAYAKLVRPGGWLVTVVPHFTLLNNFISRGACPNVVPPFHVSLFGEEALRRLLERLGDFEIVALEQGGPAAFELWHHVDVGDHWDISIPSPEYPAPRSMPVAPYSAEQNSLLNALNEAGSRMGDYFARHDGRVHLAAYCRKRK